MSDRIAKVYSGILQYQKSKEKNASPVKKSPSQGLLARRGMQSKTGAPSSKLSEVDKVASYIENIRKYRTS
jgi:hypothetical protein